MGGGIARKVLLLFALAVLFAVGLGAAVVTGVGRIAGENEKVRLLGSLRGSLTALGHFHADGRFHLNFHESGPAFEDQLTRVGALAREVQGWEDFARVARDRQFDFGRQLSYLKAAAGELFDRQSEARSLAVRERNLVRSLLEATMEPTARPAAHRPVDLLFLTWRDMGEAVTLPGLARIRTLGKESVRAGYGRLAADLQELTRALERRYLAELAIRDREEFLSTTSRRIYEAIDGILEQIIRNTARREVTLARLISAGAALSVVATFVVGLLAVRRISSFRGEFERSLRSIQRGEFDYELHRPGDDELGESLRFMKRLALDLERGRREREEGARERERLHEQLVHSQRLETIGRFAGGVAHDFNNLLTGIIGFAEIGLLRTRPGEEAHQHFESIRDGAERAAALTAQLLAFGRRQVLQRRVVDLNEIVARSAAMLERVIGEDVRLELRLGPGRLPTLADPAQIEQVIANLAVNSRDSMPRGGRITIATGAFEVLRTRGEGPDGVEPGRYVTIAVEDTGEGISKEIRDRVFEPFFTTKEVGRGTGLGLATVFGIVKQHGGEVRFQSEVGRGTRFEVLLRASEREDAGDPQASGPGMDPGPPGAPGEDLRGAGTVLVVDDNAEVRGFLSETLAAHGYQTRVAATAEEALAIIEAEAVDVILTDVVMPGTGGRELAEEAARRRPGVVTILMSGYAEGLHSGEGAPDPSPSRFLQKPLRSRTVLEAVRDALAENAPGAAQG